MASYTIKRQDGPHIDDKHFDTARQAIDFLRVFAKGEAEAKAKAKADEKLEEKKEEKKEPKKVKK